MSEAPEVQGNKSGHAGLVREDRRSTWETYQTLQKRSVYELQGRSHAAVAQPPAVYAPFRRPPDSQTSSMTINLRQITLPSGITKTQQPRLVFTQTLGFHQANSIPRRMNRRIRILQLSR